MDKLHILITGRRNSGKSSLINALTGQKIAIVSDIPGTTTDPVKKSFEIPGFASVIFVDTAGIDDEGELGKQRVNKTFEQLPRADIAILVITANRFEREEELLAERFSSLRLPFLILHNKADLSPLNPVLQTSLESQYKVPVIDFSAYDNKTVPGLLDALRRIAKISNPSPLLEGLVNPQDIVMLITPIDSEVPVGRLILPQVQAIRDILDKHCISVVLQPEEISHFYQPPVLYRNWLLPTVRYLKSSDTYSGRHTAYQLQYFTGPAKRMFSKVPGRHSIHPASARQRYNPDVGILFSSRQLRRYRES